MAVITRHLKCCEDIQKGNLDTSPREDRLGKPQVGRAQENGKRLPQQTGTWAGRDNSMRPSSCPPVT